jgi:hypothetical protein
LQGAKAELNKIYEKSKPVVREKIEKAKRKSLKLVKRLKNLKSQIKVKFKVRRDQK